jgi:hypothetical protein
MVELKLFHKILIFIAVTISLLRLTNKFAPKSNARNTNSYIPPTAPRRRPVERVATQPYTEPRTIAPVPYTPASSTVIPYSGPDHESSGVFYVRGLD